MKCSEYLLLPSPFESPFSSSFLGTVSPVGFSVTVAEAVEVVVGEVVTVEVVITVMGVGIWVAVASGDVDDILTCGVEGVGVDFDELDEVSYGHVSSPTPLLHISSTAKTNMKITKLEEITDS